MYVKKQMKLGMPTADPVAKKVRQNTVSIRLTQIAVVALGILMMLDIYLR